MDRLLEIASPEMPPQRTWGSAVASQEDMMKARPLRVPVLSAVRKNWGYRE